MSTVIKKPPSAQNNERRNDYHQGVLICKAYIIALTVKLKFF